jgi:alkylation response protein AidB-like acyl-CoA dehydrogenase
MAIDVETSKFITYQAAWKLSEGIPCMKEVAMAKAYAGDAYQRVTANAMQVHGAIGFTEEYNLHYYYKQAKSLQLMYGGGAWHRNVVAREMGYCDK